MEINESCNTGASVEQSASVSFRQGLNHNKEDQLDFIANLNFGVFKLIVLTIASFGIYYSYWLLKIRKTLPYYKYKYKVDLIVPAATIIGMIVLIFISILDGLIPVYAEIANYNILINLIGDVLVWLLNALYIIHIYLCCKIRQKLIYIGIPKNNISILYTILFQNIYLQSIINNISINRR